MRQHGLWVQLCIVARTVPQTARIGQQIVGLIGLSRIKAKFLRIRQEFGQPVRPAFGQSVLQPPFQLGRQVRLRGTVGLELLLPGLFLLRVLGDCLAEEGQHLVWHVEARLQRPAQLFLGAVQLYVARWLAVRLGSAGTCGKVVADVEVVGRVVPQILSKLRFAVWWLLRNP